MRKPLQKLETQNPGFHETKFVLIFIKFVWYTYSSTKWKGCSSFEWVGVGNLAISSWFSVLHVECWWITGLKFGFSTIKNIAFTFFGLHGLNLLFLHVYCVAFIVLCVWPSCFLLVLSSDRGLELASCEKCRQMETLYCPPTCQSLRCRVQSCW